MTKQQKKLTKRGGRRAGAGRKLGSGMYGEPTKPIRVPARFEQAVKEFIWKLLKEPRKTGSVKR
jgi:DNA polymerase V